MKDNGIQREYSEQIWSFIPHEWRFWWIEKANKICLPNVTIDYPPAKVIDSTIKINKWHSEMKKKNTYRQLQTYVMNYLFQMFYVLGVAQNIYISKCCFHFVIGITMNVCTYKKSISEPDMYKSVISARNDFFRHGNDNYYFWLFIPSWKVQPCLVILDKNSGYNFLTCCDHNNGSTLYVIHPPRNPMAHILPAPTSDQLCHAIIHSRTIKPMKTTHYSTRFQMHKSRGMFCGIDTCSLTNFGRHNFTSFLLSQTESYTIAHRTDVNPLLLQLVQEKQLSSCIVNAK